MHRCRPLLVCLFASAASAAIAGAENPVSPDSELMRQIAHTVTFGHPDQYGRLSGVQDYADGQYQAAMRQFLIGARYADKVSQLSIGLMYLQGQGVTRDPVQALAWLGLAAERRYPQFVATRDHVAGQLDPPQLARAAQLQAELGKTYGDAAAKPRLVLAMHEAMQYVDPVGRPPEGAYTYVGPPSSRPESCGVDPDTGRPIRDCGLYASWRWNPERYFAVTDAQWSAPRLKGSVIVLPLQNGGSGPAPRP